MASGPSESDVPGESGAENFKATYKPSKRHIKSNASESDITTMDAGHDSSVVEDSRILVIANRLPVSISMVQTPATGSEPSRTEIRTSVSSGGLVSALQGLRSNKANSGFVMKWIGWPGTDLSEKYRKQLSAQLVSQGCVPVYLNNNLCELYYNGFCNNVLWPLFHYIPLPLEAIANLDEQFAAYEKANKEFAKVVLKEYRDGDLVWVHDYHLMLLPRLLKQAVPNMKLGFFFHTPFPSSEIYRMLPSRRELLSGVLAANLLGFHTHDYARHFQSACSRILGAPITNQFVRHNGSFSLLGTFPIGIDPDKFLESMAKPSVQQQIDDFKRSFQGKKVLIGIDRLDYIKGIYHKLLGYERFFEQHPEWIGKVVLIQVAVPSRTDVSEYKRLKRTTHEIVARINGKYGSISSVPIHYLDQSVPFDKMVALYRFSNAALITSIRDGMNLVSFEYIVCQKDQPGCLLLSEFAGASNSLGAGAIQFNPWSFQEVADAIYQALTMDEVEGKERENFMFNHVINHTARHWAFEFITALQQTVDEVTSREYQNIMTIPTPLNMSSLFQAYKRSQSRLFVLGIGNSLIPEEPLMLEPTHEIRPLSVSNPKLALAIQNIANDVHNTVILVSSFSRLDLNRIIDFTSPGLWLAAENGFYLSHNSPLHSSEAWKCLYPTVDLAWKEIVRQAFAHFTERTPGSYIREHDSFLSWHYEHAAIDPKFVERQALELLTHLSGGPLANTSTEVVHIGPVQRTPTVQEQKLSSCIIVRPTGVSKGLAIQKVINRIARNQKIVGIDSTSEPITGDETNSESDGGPSQQVSISERRTVHSMDRLKYPVDFVLCMGRFMDRDQDIYNLANEYVAEGMRALTATQSSPLPKLSSLRSLAGLRCSGTDLTSLSMEGTPTANASMLASSSPSPLHSPRNSEFESITERVKRFFSDTAGSGTPPQAHREIDPEPEMTSQPSYTYSLPSPTLGSTSSPAVAGFRSRSRANSGRGSEFLLDTPVTAGRRLLQKRTANSLRVNIFRKQRKEPVVFTVSLGDAPTRASSFVRDVEQVGRVLIALSELHSIPENR